MLNTGWGKFWAAIAGFSALVGFGAAVGQCIDVYRNTFPEIRLNGQAAEPFLLPFSIKNPSAIFEMKNTEFRCHPGKDGVRIGDVVLLGLSFSPGGVATIPPGRTANFRCPIASAPGPLMSGTIYPVVTYRTLFFSRSYEGQAFTWFGTANPPRWIEGDIPQ